MRTNGQDLVICLGMERERGKYQGAGISGSTEIGKSTELLGCNIEGRCFRKRMRKFAGEN